MPALKTITAQEQALEALGSFLRNEREVAGLSQLAVAAQAGVSQPLYAGIEAGHRPLTAHRASEFGDSVVLGTIKYLLTQLKSTRLQLVNASDARMCSQSMSTLAELITKSGQVCAVMAAALADGRVDDHELDQMEENLSKLDEVVHKTRTDIAIIKEVRKRERQVAPGLVSTRTGSGIQAKAVR